MNNKAIGFILIIVALVGAAATVNADTTSEPVANAGSDQTVNLSRYNNSVTVYFSGAGSYDPDGGSIVSYSWLFFFGGSPSTGSGVTSSTTYTSTGNYWVGLTVTDDEGATDNDICHVYVKSYPNAVATVSPSSPDTTTSVSFDGTGSNDPDGGTIQSYRWVFGDGSTGSGSSPSHTYTSVGTYTAQLTVTDDEGDSGYDTLSVTVTPPPNQPPTARISGGNRTVNINTPVNFDGSSSDDLDDDSLTYTWSFGSGAYSISGTSSEQSSCRYNSVGSKTVRLTVSDGKASDSASITVSVKAPPTANAGSDQSVEIGMLVSFRGSGSDPDGGAPVTYRWNLGGSAYDITGSTTASPRCRYSTPGRKTVWLAVTDDENDTTWDSLTVSVANIPPVARATGMAPGEYINLSRDSGQASYTFSDGGSYDPDGGPLTYAWSVTGGISTSPTTSPSVSVTYNSFGTKSAVLTVRDNEGATDSANANAVIKTYPVVSVTYSPSSPDTTTSITFDGTGSHDPDNGTTNGAGIPGSGYRWDFGDGSTGSGSTTTHSYSAADTYTVSLTITDDEGDSTTGSVSVAVSRISAPPECDDLVDKTIFLDESVSYSASCEDPDGGTPTYSWRFGDGASDDNVTSVTHSYSEPDEYTVTLTATDDEGDFTTKTATVTVNNRPPTATILGGNQLVEADQLVSFRGEGSDPDLGTVTFSWDFGDDAYDTQSTHSTITTVASCKYREPGNKTVTLTVEDDEGDSTQARIMVTVEKVYTDPVARATTLVDRVNLSPDTDQVTVEFNGSGSYDPDGGDITEYSWDFGRDANPPSLRGEQYTNASCTYSSTGARRVRLVVYDDDMPRGFDEDYVDITVLSKPVVIIENPATVTLAGDPARARVTFDGSKSHDPDDGTTPGAGIENYSWRFDDNANPSSAEGENRRSVTVTYSAADTYTAWLTVTDNDMDTGIGTSTVTVVARPDQQPVAIIAGGDRTVNRDPNTETVEVSFDGSNSHDPDDGTEPGDGIESYVWSFGDGTSTEGSPSQNSTVSHVYNTAGSMDVTLEVEDAEDNTASAEVTITVLSLPVAVPGDDITVDRDPITKSVNVSFDGGASHDPDDGTGRGDGIDSYLWRFGDGDTSDQATVSHTYATAGEHEASLTVRDNEGEEATKTRLVTIKAKPVAKPGDSRTVNLDPDVPNHKVEVTLNGSASYDPDNGDTPGSGIEAHDWYLGTTLIGSGEQIEHSFNTLGSKSVSLTVTDDENKTGSASITVTVKSLPVIIIDGGDREVYLEGDPASVTVSFDGGASYDPDNGNTPGSGIGADGYAWSFDGGPVVRGQSVQRTYTAVGMYSATLTVTDDDSDINSATIMVDVRDNRPPTAVLNVPATVTLDYTLSPPSVSVTCDGSDSTDADGRVVEYRLDFGDDSTAVEGEDGDGVVSHIYTAPGTHTVELTVKDDGGATHSVIANVTVLAKPVAVPGPDRSITLDRDTDRFRVDFDGRASHDPDDGTHAGAGIIQDGYLWRFHDNTTSTDAETSYTYSSPGEKTVSLTVTDNEGATGEASLIVTVYTYPTAIIAGGDREVTLDSNGSVRIQFDGRPSHDPDDGTYTEAGIDGYSWTFHDGGTTSDEAQPTKIYSTTGDKSVSLTVTDNEGLDSAAVSITVTVLPAPTRPVAIIEARNSANEIVDNVNLDPTIENDEVTVTFDGSKSHDPDDGTNPGDGIEVYSWDFGGGMTSGETRVRRTYNTLGAKTARLTVTDNDGVQSDAVSKTVTVKSFPVVVIEGDRNLTLGLGGSPIMVTLDAGGSYDPDDGTNAGLGISGYEWRQGADDTGTVLGSESTLSRTFSAAGDHTYRLIVTDNEGDTASADVTVTVTKALTDPIAVAEAFDSANQAISSINLDPTIANHSVSVTFKGGKSHDPDDGTQPGDGIDDYAWIFSDGETDDSANVTRSFSSTGAITGTLKVTDNERVQSDAVSKTVSVMSLPKIVVTGGNGVVYLDPTSNSASVTLDASGSHDPDDGTTAGLGISGYVWRQGVENTGRVLGRQSMLDRTFSAAGVFTYRLTVTDNDGDTASADITVTVEPAPDIALELSGPDTITRGESGTYTASITPANLSFGPLPTFRWKYTATVERATTHIRKNITPTTETPQLTTWRGAMIESGTLEVRVTVNNQQLTQTLSVTVNGRDWVTEIPITKDTTDWGSEAPVSHADLGEIVYDIDFTPETDLTTTEVSSGPNKGIKYTSVLNLRAPYTIRINRHFGVAETGLPTCWSAFKNANARYADFESEVKSYLGFDGTARPNLLYYWENKITVNDLRRNIDSFLAHPETELASYRNQVVRYLTSIIPGTIRSMNRTVSRRPLRVDNANYDYFVLAADAGENQTVGVGSEASFAGTWTHTPDCGVIADYVWDFGDGNSYDWDRMDNSIVDTLPATHTYADNDVDTDAGVYDVSLTVTNNGDDTVTDDLTLTAFKGNLSVDTTEIVIPDDSASGAGGASDEGTTKSTTPPIIDPPPGTIPPIVTPPTVNLPPSTVTITCDVLPAGFTPTSVAAEVHNGDALDATTLVKAIALTETSSGSDSYTGTWDGMDGNNVPVANGDFQIIGVIIHLVIGGAAEHKTPPKIVSARGTVTVRTLAGTDPDDNSAIVDTLYDSSQPDPDRTEPGVIHYEISGAVIENLTVREITLEIDNNTDPSDESIISILLPNATGFQRAEWDGRFVGIPADAVPTPPYGPFYVHIGLKLDTDNNPATWESFYVSKNYRTITVYSLPIADAGPNQTVTLDSATSSKTVDFNGGGSNDPDGGDIQKYEWDFGDNTASVTKNRDPDTPNPHLVSHTYTEAGTYTVELEVTDNEGHISRRDRMTVTVSEIAVSILAASDSTATVDTVYSHNLPDLPGGVRPTDQTVAARIQYEITGGNAAAETQLRFTLEIDDDQDIATGPTTTVVKTEMVDAGAQLARSGYIDWNGRNGAAPLYGMQYAQIMLQVNSDADAEWEQEIRSDFHQITVDSFPVAVAVASVTGEKPSDNVTATLDSTGPDATATVEFNGGDSNDPDGGDIQSYTWDFGDDTTGSGVQPSHEYTEAGTYTVKLTVTDNEGHATPEERAGTVTVTVDPKIDVTIDADNSDSYLAANQDMTSAIITYEVNPSVWKEIEPTSENTDVSSPVSIEIKEDGADGMMILTESLRLPTDSAQTYSWNGREAPTIGPGGTETPGDFVEPGVYEVKISVVRDPNADAPEIAAEATHQITVFGIAIASADITNDRIHVDLEPANLTGTFTLSLFDPEDSNDPEDNPVTHQIRQEEKASGGYDESFNITGLAAEEYRQVVATWVMDGVTASDEHDYHIHVLSLYNHTFYNTPDENGQMCREVAREEPFDYTEGGCRIIHDCETTEAQGRFRWLEERFENGSGLDRNGQIFSGEGWCAPADDVNQRYFVRLSGQTCVFCPPIDNALRVGLDVAVNSRNQHLRCNDRVFVHNLLNTEGGTAGGVFTVRDRGGGVGVTELDHYHGVSDCNVVPGNREDVVTVKLFE